MELTKKAILLLLLVGVLQPADAQIFKKIGERAAKAAERTVLNKTDQKVSQKVGDGIDDAVDGKPKKKKAGQQQGKEQDPHWDASIPVYRDVYTFTHRYKMKVSTGKEGADATLDYYLAPSVSYTGMKIDQQGANMFTVIDPETETMHTFMDLNGNKIANSVSMRYDGDEEEDRSDAADLLNYNITNLPDKTIAGHRCKGKQLEDDENRIVFYYTTLNGIRLNLFQGDKKQQVLLPSNLKGLFDAESLVMYMEVMEKKGKKQKMVMECVEVKPTDFTFNTAGYQQTRINY